MVVAASAEFDPLSILPFVDFIDPRIDVIESLANIRVEDSRVGMSIAV